MNVRKYRAQTTREALEQVKQDLGEDAFVLETKQISSKGFFGLRSRNEVEISAAPAKDENTADSFPAVQKASSSLEMIDDSEAAPQQHPVIDQHSREKILNALAVRAASAKNGDRVLPMISDSEPTIAGVKPIEVVELASHAPRIVHARKSPVPVPAEAAGQPIQKPESVRALPAQSAAVSGSLVSHNDFERIRAELREVKFALNSFGSATPRAAFDFNFERDSAIFDYPFYDTYLEICKTGFDPANIRKHLAEFVPQFSNGNLPSDNLSRLVVKKIIGSSVTLSGDPLENKRILALIGATGVGKTTTIAKLAARSTLEFGKRVELVTLDTYRIAAVEQLKTYAEIIGAGCHVVRSVSELDDTIAEIGEDATILIDTTGRSPYDLSDQFEVSDYLFNNSGIHKCLALQATLNPHDALASIRKFEMYGADSLVLTKLDETARPGSIIETASSSSLPVSYFCMGQRVPEDIRIASIETITDQVLPANIHALKMSA